MSAWLITPMGTRVHVDTNGVVIGRSPDCDIVAFDVRISRRQLSVRQVGQGVEYVRLGRGPTTINGEPAVDSGSLSAGDVIGLAGHRFEVIVDAADLEAPPPIWVLEGADGTHGVTRFPFLVGGGSEDHLVISAWPAGGARLLAGAVGPGVCLHGVMLNGAALSDDTVAELKPGDALSAGGVTLVVRLRDPVHTTTHFAAEPTAPVRAVLKFLPRGGLLTLQVGDQEVVIALADLRCDLIATLLQAPEGYTSGDFIPDDLVMSRIWGAAEGKSRKELNVLIHRVRRDFTQAGLVGMDLIQRAPGGGGTRFALAEGANVRIE